MKKIIFFDIDGTLRPFETGRIPEKTREAILRAREAGVKTCIATGRHWLEMQVEDLIEDIPFDAFVTLDGNYCYILEETSLSREVSSMQLQPHPSVQSPVTALSAPGCLTSGDVDFLFDASERLTDCYYDPRRGRQLCSNPIPRSAIEKLLHFLEATPYPVIFQEERKLYVNFVNDDLRRSFEEVHSIIPPVKPLQDVLEQDIFMLIPIMPYEDSLRLSDALPECQILRWSDGLSFDLTPAGVNKVHGIDLVLEHYGISLSDAAAVGDGLNDLKMLSHVGLGIAMGNAAEPCKSAADWVAPHILEDGLAVAVDYILSH